METRTTAPDLDQLRAVVERWLREARDMCTPTTYGPDLDWLAGRIRALHDVAAFLRDGADNAPPGSLPVEAASDPIGGPGSELDAGKPDDPSAG